MKKLLLLLCICLSMIACKKESQAITEVATTAQENLRTFKGEFIYLADAAVLKVGNTMYAVDLDKKMHELADKVAPKKQEEYDMVEVVIKGTVRPRPQNEEGWPYIITIKEIVQVLESKGDKPIKIESATAQN